MWNDAGKSREYMKRWKRAQITETTAELSNEKATLPAKRPPMQRHLLDKSSHRKRLTMGGLVWEPGTTCGDTTASKKTRSDALKRRRSFRSSVWLLGEPVKYWVEKKAKKKTKDIFGGQMMLLIATQSGMAQPITCLDQKSMADRTFKNNYFLRSAGTLDLSLPSKAFILNHSQQRRQCFSLCPSSRPSELFCFGVFVCVDYMGGSHHLDFSNTLEIYFWRFCPVLVLYLLYLCIQNKM